VHITGAVVAAADDSDVSSAIVMMSVM